MEHNSGPKTDLSENECGSDNAVFGHIVRAARGHWIPVHPKLDACLFVGHMTAWHKRSIRVILSYRSEGCRIRLQGTVADHVQEDSDTFRDLLSKANAAYPNAKAIFEREHNLIIAQSNGDCPTHIDEIPRVVTLVYEDFSSLVNDETFYTAIAVSGARLSGTPIDIWEHE